ncbi:hypothetical protein [Lactobacillus xujianguonis]|uniref:hypothetical protein n=1 Tax=Lactobacillus xujianguonis TaxID=2495899 RepID=UPI000FD73EC6|nr:hypothetical protein [Lactobacillus xujianguonis]RVU73624.1 hypothetical protein EJK20_07430 [Lactobacillus xujianguonis]
MSKYNKSVLTDAGLDLARRANAGKAKFKITRAVTSADDLSDTPIEQLAKVTEISNIMQTVQVTDAEEVEDNEALIGVSLRFTNKELKQGYKIRIIGLYAQEDGQANDFLYAISTAVEPEYLPAFDGSLYRFSQQFYVVVGRANNVSVVIDDSTVVTIKKFEDHIKESNGKIEALKKQLEDGLKQDGKVETISVDGGEKLIPVDKNINIPLHVDQFVQKSELSDSQSEFTKSLQQKFDLSKLKFRKQQLDNNGYLQDKTWSATPNGDGTYTINLYNDDWTASKLYSVIEQVNGLSSSKADKTAVVSQVQDAKNAVQSNLEEVKNNLNGAISNLNNGKLNFKYVSDGYDLLSDDRFWGVIEANNVQGLKNAPSGMNNKNWMYAFKLIKDSFGTVMILDQDNHIWVNNKNGDIWNGWKSYAKQDDLDALQKMVTNQAQEIRYIKANYIEGKRFSKSQESDAQNWENQNPQRIAFIEDN